MATKTFIVEVPRSGSLHQRGDGNAADFDPRQLPGNYLSGFGGYGDLGKRFTIDGWKLADFISSGDWLAPWQTMPKPSTFNDPSFAANTWTVTEDIDTADWDQPGVETMLERVKSGRQQGGNVVLLHDAGGDRTDQRQQIA